MACAGPDLENRITMVVLIQILGFLPSILSAMAADVISLFFERGGGGGQSVRRLNSAPRLPRKTRKEAHLWCTTSCTETTIPNLMNSRRQSK